MDELKKYLQQHREGLDADTPPDSVWERIHQKPAAEPRARLLRMGWQIAAAVCILAVVFFGVRWMVSGNEPAVQPNENFSKTIPPQISTDTVPGGNIVPQSPAIATAPAGREEQPSADALLKDFQETYGLIVKMQVNSIRNTPVLGEEPGYFNDFRTRLNQMDADETAIKKNIKKNGVTTALLEQLINVYQQKIDVLKSLHSEIDKMNNKVRENHAPSDEVNAYYINI